MNFWCPLMNVPCLEDITFFGKLRSGTPTFSWLLHYCKTWSEILWYMSLEERNTEHPSFYQLWIIESSCTVSALCRRRKTPWGVYVSFSGSPMFQLLRSPAFTSSLAILQPLPAPPSCWSLWLDRGMKKVYPTLWGLVSGHGSCWSGFVSGLESMSQLWKLFPDLPIPICWLLIKSPRALVPLKLSSLLVLLVYLSVLAAFH